MEITRLSTKGQVILPKVIRDARAWRPGMEFTVEEAGDGIVLRPAERFPESDLAEVAGCLRSKTLPKQPAQMSAAIEREVRRRRGHGRY